VLVVEERPVKAEAGSGGAMWENGTSTRLESVLARPMRWIKTAASSSPGN